MAQQKPLVVGAYGEPARIQGGDTLDPAVLGSGTRDGTRFLRDDGTYVPLNPNSSVSVAFSAYPTVDTQSIPTSTSTTLIFGGEQVDTIGCFNTSTGRFTPTIAGYYQVTVGCWVACTGNNITCLEINAIKNGNSTFAKGITKMPSGMGNGYAEANGLVYLNGTTDYIEAQAYTNGTGVTFVSGYGASRFSGYLTGAVTNTGSAVAFKAYRSDSTQTLTTGVWNKVNLNADDFDSAGVFDSATNYRFQPTVAGYYQLNGSVEFGATSGLTGVMAGISKNGALSNLSGGIVGSGITLSGTSGVGTVAGLLYFNGTTDYAELAAFSMAGTGVYVVGTSTRLSTLSGALFNTGLPQSVTFNLSGSFTVPQTGTARKYFSAATAFSKATIGVGSTPSGTLTATIKKNGTSVGTITIAAGQYYNTNLQSISISAGDYLTVDVSGAGASDLVLTLE